MILVLGAYGWGTSPDSFTAALKQATIATRTSVAEFKKAGYYALAFPEGAEVSVDGMGGWSANVPPVCIVDQQPPKGQGRLTLADLKNW